MDIRVDDINSLAAKLDALDPNADGAAGWHQLRNALTIRHEGDHPVRGLIVTAVAA